MAHLEIVKCTNQISSGGQSQNAIQGTVRREEGPHHWQGATACKGGLQLGSLQSRVRVSTSQNASGQGARVWSHNGSRELPVLGSLLHLPWNFPSFFLCYDTGCFTPKSAPALEPRAVEGGELGFWDP